MSEPAASPSRNPLRRLYNWVLHWAETPYGVPALVIIAFVESSFFPIPPDILLIAMALSMPTSAFRFAAWCTLSSVLGGMFGYLIGYSLWPVFEPLLIGPIISSENFTMVEQKYQEYGELAVFTAAFTPIPYKVFTIAAGVANLDFGPFCLASLLGRGGRFFLVAWLIRQMGPRAKQWIEANFNWATLAGTILLIGGFILIKVLR